uniref:Adrenodoxin-like n=1 Tax=Pogona vitticeps TaxID=103695 RepID=A0A6J0SYF1_9SAUR
MAWCVFRLSRLGPAVHRAHGLGSLGPAHRRQCQLSLHPGRWFSRSHGLRDVPGDPGSTDKVLLHFVNRDGEKFTVTAKEGESLLEVVMNQNLSIDGFGACEGALACSTCHLIFEEDAFRQLGPTSDEELDMLDLAFGLTDTSRLGCQVHVKKWMNGLTVHVPVEVSDLRKELEAEKQSKR